MEKFLEVLRSPLFLNSVIGVLVIASAILKVIGSIVKKQAVNYAGEVVDLVADIFRNSSNETKLTRAIDLLRNKVLEKTPKGFQWLVNACLSTQVLKFAIERTITVKKVTEHSEEMITDKISDVVVEKILKDKSDKNLTVE